MQRLLHPTQSLKFIATIKPGQHFYSDSPAIKFTHLARWKVKLKTERLIVIGSKSLQGYRITKVTIVKNPLYKK